MGRADDVQPIGHNTAADLKQRVRETAGLKRVEQQLKARTKEVATQIKDNYERAKSAGHDVGIMKTVIKEALMPLDERAEHYETEEYATAILEATREALGLREDDDPLGIAAEAATRAAPHADLLTGNDVIDDDPVMDSGKGKKGAKR